MNKIIGNEFSKATQSLLRLMVAAVLAILLAPAVSFVAQNAWADDAEGLNLVPASNNEFNAQVVSAKWVESKVLEIEFDQAIALSENSRSNISITSFWEVNLGANDVLTAEGNTVTIRFATGSYSNANVYGINFKANSLVNSDGQPNTETIVVSEFEDWSKVVTKVTYTPSSLSSNGGQVVAQLEGTDLNGGDGWIAAYLYEGTTQVRKLNSNTEYDWQRLTYTFTVPANMGTAAKEYHLKFVKSNFTDTPVPVLEGANDVVTVAGLPVAAQPEVTEMSFSTTTLKAAGGEVVVTLKGEALTQLTTADLSLQRDGQDAGIEIAYNAPTDKQATATFTLPANDSTTDAVTYSFAIARGADSVEGNPQEISVKPINTQALVEHINYIDRNMDPYHHGAGDFTLFYTAGNVKVLLQGENLDKLVAQDFVLEAKQENGDYSAIDGKVRIDVFDAQQALVTFTVPANVGEDAILTPKYYRFTVSKADPSLENKTQEFKVDRREEQLGSTKFRIATTKWGASMVDKGVVRIWVEDPKVELNPAFTNGTLDIKDYVFFSNQEDEPYSTTRMLTSEDKVEMRNGDIFIELADKDAEIPFYVVFKGESLVSNGLVLSTRDEYTKLYHKRYINQGAHLEAITYDQITYNNEGGHVHAVLRGTQLTLSDPELSGKVFIDSEKEPSAIKPTIEVAENGLSATVDFDVPANTTDRTISYRFIPVVNGTNFAPTYLIGYDVVSVLPEGGKTTDVTLSSVELTGDGDLDDRLDVLTTSTSSEKFTSKIYATLRGTNLSSKKAAVKAVDENGVVWPTLPVFECGATIRWQSSATYMPEKESVNEQVIELLPPRRLGVPHTFTLYFAPDGKNYLDAPVGTVILDNQGLFDYEDMANRRFTEEDLTTLIEVKVKYVDEAGKEIAPADTLKGYGITEMYHQPIAAKDIAGHTLKRTNPNNLDIMMSQPEVHTTGEYIFKNGQYFFRDLLQKNNANIEEDRTIKFVYTKDVDKTALEKAVKAAQDTQKGVKISKDGSDVSSNEKYVTPTIAKQLSDAITNAENVLGNKNATQTQIDAAKKRLDTAKTAYDKAKKAGAKPATVKITKVAAANATYAGAASLPKPVLTVTGADGKAVPASGYTATWAYNTGYGKQPAAGGKYVGVAKVTVKGKGAYTGSASAIFKITTVADGTKAGAALNEKTVTAIEKLKSGSAAVPQASSKTMETIAKPRAKQMQVKWAAVKGATNYLVGYKRASAKEWSYVVSGGKTQYTFNNMKEGDLLEFRVAVYDGKKFARGEWTQINCRFMREMVSLKAKAGAGKIDLSWGKVSGATGYQILLGTKKDLSDAKIITVKGGSTAKTTLTTIDGTPKGKALAKGKTYYLKVRPIKSAKNANGKTNTYIGIQSLARECKITTTALAI